ncbi:MAG TPA: acyl-ACP thioesterase domain-containing protein [Conexibacter sp.]|jgi:acyl-ACP thioesterase
MSAGVGEGGAALGAPETQEIPPFPTVGRAHALERLVGIRDVTPEGRARLDAIVDWFQHVAYADVLDAGIDKEAAWIVRRTTVRVTRFPQLGETVELKTACSGYGTFWAERRTQVRGSAGAAVEGATIWVSLDPATLRPMRPLAFLGIYGESAGDRRVRAKLRHAAPPPDASASAVAWPLRAADLDPAGHVNNSVYWQAIEEGWQELPAGGGLVAEAEHHAPALGGMTLLRSGERAWLAGEDGTMHASFVLRAET